MRREYLVGVLLFVMTVLIRGYYIWLPIDYFIREGSTGMTAWRILEGQIMYRDFYYGQAPLWGYLVAMMYALLGIGLAQGRILVVLWSGVTVCFIFFSGLREVNMKGGLLGGLIIALHPLSIRYGTLLLNDFPALTLALIGFYMLNRSYKNVNLAKNRVKTENGFWNTYQRILFAGVCLGLAVSIKLIMAPIFVAFFIIIIIEGHIDDISLNTRAKTIGILVLGFVITVGAILTPFLLIAKDAFIDQILGQHLSKTSYPGVTWLSRIGYAPSRYWDVDKILLIILLLSIPFALKNRYGRGLIVIAAILIIAIILLVPRPHLNYYDMHLPTIAMVCGYFPLSISTLLNLRKKFQWNRVVISQILGWILIVGYIFTIALSPSNNIQPMDEESFKAVQWLKANTDQDEYILCDDTNINIMAQRRGPFAEVSIDRMDLGRQTTDMLIQSLYDYHIRIVVVTGRLFGRFPVYDAFMEFLEVNYTKIEMGFSIYVRDSPLI